MNNKDNDYTIYCSRCGAEMKSGSRYCMKCGNLNYEHEANSGMRKYIKDKNNGKYEVGAGKFIFSPSNNQIRIGVATNTGNKTICFLVNIILYLLCILVCFFSTVNIGNNFSFENIMNSFFPIIAIVITIYFIYFYALELLFMKFNRPWWSVLVPIYNFMVIADVLFKNKVLGLICFVPVIGPFFLAFMLYKLGEKFKFNGLLTVFFFVIVLPLLAFGNYAYEGYTFVEDGVSLEKEYKYKKTYLGIVFLVLIFCGVCFVAANVDNFNKISKKVGKYYYVYTANKIVNKTKKRIEKYGASCDAGDFSKNTGIYYFYYSDIGDEVYLPFYVMRESISGYVKVEYDDGVPKYYVSISDGEKGFEETLNSDVNTDIVKDYSELSIDKDNDYICNFIY